MMDVKFQADTKMADSKRELELQKASFNQEVNTKVGALKAEPAHGLSLKLSCVINLGVMFLES